MVCGAADTFACVLDAVLVRPSARQLFNNLSSVAAKLADNVEE